jgi:DNA-binding NarL/FixJ family response regulator
VPTLLIVDDHAAVRAGLQALVAAEPDLEVVGTVPDGQSALALVERESPDLAVIDFHLPHDDGLSLCLRLDGTPVPPGRVLYSAFADDLLAVLAAVAGADALVPKSADPDDLIATLLDVAAGRHERPSPTPAALNAVSAALEPADIPILAMLVHGTPPDEIAATLDMSSQWLHARRWAMLRRLTPRRARRGGLDDAAHLLGARR